MSVCSFPGCRLLTRFIPYGREKQKSVNIGEGAHITAAAEGGPRYDAALTPRERASAANGIWLCCNHAHYIDVASDLISAELLHEWKKQHEADVRDGKVNESNVRYHTVCRRIKEVAICGIGSFKKPTTIRLGRVSFLQGDNGVGKTAVWQMASLFSRGVLSTIAQKRFLKHPRGDMSVEVRFLDGQEEHVLSKEWKRTAEGHSKVSSSKLTDVMLVKSLFNVIVLDCGRESPYSGVREREDELRSFMARLAKMLGVSLSDAYEAVRALTDRVTVIGCRIRVVGKQPTIQVDVRGDGRYLDSGNLAHSELLLAELDILIRCVISISVDQYWLIVIEGAVMNRLDDCKKLRDVIFGLPDNFQILCCTSRENVIPFMVKGRENTFEHQNYGALTVWASTKEVNLNSGKDDKGQEDVQNG